MLALDALPLALVLGLLAAIPSTLAAPCSPLPKRAFSTSAPTSSSSSADGFAVPAACSSTCASYPTLISLDSCTTDTCTSYCAAGGLDPYVDCSNCVLENASPSLSRDDYDSIVAGLVLVLQSCSAAGAAVAPGIDLIDFDSLNPTLSSVPAVVSTASATTTTPAVRVSGFPTSTGSYGSATAATSEATATAVPATNVAASVNDQAIGASSHALAAVRPARAAAAVGVVVGLAAVLL